MTLFHYIHKDTVLHRMDGRLKLASLLLFSLAAGFASDLPDYLAPLSVLICSVLLAKLPFTVLLKEMRFFGVIILIVIVVNAFTFPGDPILKSPFASISRQGVIAGLRFAGRLSIVLLVSTVITGTTPLTRFRDAIEWYLRPVPFVPEAWVATMINLTFLLIPVLPDSFKEIRNAQNSRCGQLRKNPVKRMKYLVFPLLGQTLRRADEIVNAMEARCYSEVRTKATFKCKKTDWFLLAISFAVFLFVLL